MNMAEEDFLIAITFGWIDIWAGERRCRNGSIPSQRGCKLLMSSALDKIQWDFHMLGNQVGSVCWAIVTMNTIGMMQQLPCMLSLELKNWFRSITYSFKRLNCLLSAWSFNCSMNTHIEIAPEWIQFPFNWSCSSRISNILSDDDFFKDDWVATKWLKKVW